MNCPVCLGSNTELSNKIEGKEYFRCHTCQVLFLTPKHHLSLEEEKDRSIQDELFKRLDDFEVNESKKN